MDPGVATVRNLLRIGTCSVRNVHRFARVVGVIHQTCAVNRPSWFHCLKFQKKARRASSDRRYSQRPKVRNPSRELLVPDRSVTGEPQASYKVPRTFSGSSLAPYNWASTRFTQPVVERSIAVGDECHELAV